MGAVVSFVEDAFEAVGDVFEAVGDVVEDVVDFVGDVVDTVGDVVQAVIDDPLPVLLSVAGSFVGIPPYVTMGAITAARGGDLEDIALSMGTSFIASGVGGLDVGGAISSTVSETFIEAGLNETFSEIASNSISKGLINGTIAEIKGGSFEDGFAGGFTGGLVAGGVGEVGDYVKPDVIALAQESGLDLREATSLYNAGTRAVSAGITSEITGRGDFATSFTNSAIGSGIDSGTRSLNSTIDEQFATAAYDWNKQNKDGETIDTTAVGAGIPNEVVGQVTVTGYGVDNTPDTNIISETNTTNNVSVLADDDSSGETAVSDVAILPTTTSGSTTLSQAPTAESTTDFADLINTTTAGSGNTVLASNTDTVEVPDDVADIAETLTATTETPITQGALSTIADATKPVDVLDVVTPDSTVATDTTVNEKPIAGDLLATGLPSDQPVGGLNAVSAKTADQKMADSLGLKPTDITKPVVATFGNLLKSTLKQGTKPPARTVAKKPAGALQTMAKAPRPQGMPPAKMDVAKLIPIQKAAPAQPAKTLASTAKLSPVTNIAGLTSMLKKTG
jgi:hypothetical protein